MPDTFREGRMGIFYFSLSLSLADWLLSPPPFPSIRRCQVRYCSTVTCSLSSLLPSPPGSTAGVVSIFLRRVTVTMLHCRSERDPPLIILYNAKHLWITSTLDDEQY
jgi:hypothetical protein